MCLHLDDKRLALIPLYDEAFIELRQFPDLEADIDNRSPHGKNFPFPWGTLRFHGTDASLARSEHSGLPHKTILLLGRIDPKQRSEGAGWGRLT
jgi:hypothetical protein